MARDWSGLSARTQKSYTGTGAKQMGWSPAQVQAYYESGESLKALRRHTKTPESPSDVIRSKNPEQYRDYVEKRQNISGGTLDRKEWADKYVKNFQRQFGSNPSFNRTRLKERSQITDPSSELYIHTDELIKGANSSQDELVKLARDVDEVYGKRRRNPFHYH